MPSTRGLWYWRGSVVGKGQCLCVAPAAICHGNKIVTHTFIGMIVVVTDKRLHLNIYQSTRTEVPTPNVKGNYRVAASGGFYFSY